MASPHIQSLTEVEWGSKSHRVFNLTEDIIKKQTHRGGAHIPAATRPHFVAGAIWTEPSFSTWLCGAGAVSTEPPIKELLQSCGLYWIGGTPGVYVANGTYGSSFTGVSIDTAKGDGLKIPCGSCAGDLVVTLRPGEAAECAWNFFGTYTEPTEAALSSTLETAAHPPPCKGLTIKTGNDTLILKEAVIRLNNTVNSPNLDMSHANAAAPPYVTNQDATIETLAILPAYSTANYFTDWTNENKATSTTLDGFSAVIGSVQYNIITISADVYLYDYALEDVDGVQCIRCFYEVSTDAGDTDLTFAFT